MSTGFVESAARAAVLPAAAARDDSLLQVRRHADRPRQLARGVRMNAAAAAAADYSSSSDDLTAMRGAGMPRSSSMVFGRDQNKHHLANHPVPGARSRAASRDSPRRVIRVSRTRDPSPAPAAAQSDSEVGETPRTPRRIRVTRLKAATTETAAPAATAPETISKPSVVPAAPAAPAAPVTPISRATPVERPVIKAKVAAEASAPEVKAVEKQSTVQKAAVVPETPVSKTDTSSPAPTVATSKPLAAQKVSKPAATKVSPEPPTTTKGNGKKPEPEKPTPLYKRLNIIQAIEFSIVATGACITSYATMCLLSGLGSMF